MAKRISVVIPVFNRAKLLIRCLDSIINQSVVPYEIIIVDNGSEDDSYIIAEDWMQSNNEKGAHIKLYKENKRGAYKARQRGLNEVTGDFVIFFDSDDAMRPNLIEKALEKITIQPDLDIICWKCKIKHLNGSTRISPFYPENAMECHLLHTLLRPQGYLVKTNFIKSAGGWSKPLEVWDDMELGFRLLLKEPKISGINEILADIYSQEESITGTDFSSKEGKWEKTLSEIEKENEKNNHRWKEEVRKIIKYRQLVLAADYAREKNKKASDILLKKSLAGENRIIRLMMKISYQYIKRGGRGVWRLMRYRFNP